MPQVSVTLNIGHPTATQEDVIWVDDEDLEKCLNEDQRQEVLNSAWMEWVWEHIDGTYEIKSQ